MSSSSNTSIAKKARTKAEADFATWLMMAKLGGFDDLPSNAQSFLTNYRTRLETMSEAESRAVAVRFGLGLVCENHPDRAWDRDVGCECGAGMPCECQRASGLEPPDVSKIISNETTR